jgi:membrane protease YdiL (CAAX protease family)
MFPMRPQYDYNPGSRRASLRRLTEWVHGNPVTAFPAVYLGWAYLFWAPILISQSPVWELPGLVWFLLGGASPLLAGILLASADGGRQRVKGLFRRLVDWRRIPAWWWVFVVLFWLAFDLAMAGIALLVGVSESPIDPDWGLFREPSSLLFVLLLSFVFPAVEEIGLRGYYLDALQSRLSPAIAALVNGCVWAIWHAPFVWFAGYYANTTFHPALSWWLPMIVCHTLLIAFLYNHTRRSILAVLVFHGVMNFTGEWLRISRDMYPFMLTGAVAVALLVIGRLKPPAEVAVNSGPKP